MKKMLINATHKEEVRIALVEENELIDLDIEQKINNNKKSNIYNGHISRVEPSLEACFVNYGSTRDGFLPFKDIDPRYYDNDVNKFKEKIVPGKRLIVQVTREERGQKGAALTTQISLASTFLVLMPFSDKQEGISRRLSSEEREALKRKLSNIDDKDGKGIIVRTAGTGCTEEELAHDLKVLNFIWQKIQEYAEQNEEVGILHHESETIVRVLRDYLTKDVEEIITDSQEAYDKANHYLNLVRPENTPKITLYRREQEDLFTHFRIEEQISTAFQRNVSLKSGGELVFDTTEALTSIDVNSSKSTGGPDIENTAFNTNMEAAREICRQLKIRDLGGLIVIDFIDMGQKSNIRKVEELMKELTKDDRARCQTAPISRFGLMEVSRQRIRGSIAESTNHICPRCSGTGFILDNESQSLQILREMTKEVSKPGRAIKLHVLVPVDIAAFLVNEKREEISQFEKNHNIQVMIIPDNSLESPHFNIQKVRRGDNQVKELASYKLPEYYREQSKNNKSGRKNLKDTATETLHHSSTSVPDEHQDKTFEARLEKADFIKKRLNQDNQKPTLFARFAMWFKGLFSSNKVKEVKTTPITEEKNKRKKSRKSTTRRRKSERLKDENINSSNEKTIKVEKLEKNEKVDKVEKSEKVRFKKEITSGNTVEQVVGNSKKTRKRNKKSNSIDLTLDDINPQQIKAEVEAKEAENKANSTNTETRLSRAERRRLKKEKSLAANNENIIETEYDYNLNEEVQNKSSSENKNQKDSVDTNTKNSEKENRIEEKKKADNSSSERKAKKEKAKRQAKRRDYQTESYDFILEPKEFVVDKEIYQAWSQEELETPKLMDTVMIINNENSSPVTIPRIFNENKASDRTKKNHVCLGTLNSSDFELSSDKITTVQEPSIKENKVNQVAKYRKEVFKAPQPCVNFFDKKSFDCIKKLRQKRISLEAKRKEKQVEVNNKLTQNLNKSEVLSDNLEKRSQIFEPNIVNDMYLSDLKDKEVQNNNDFEKILTPEFDFSHLEDQDIEIVELNEEEEVNELNIGKMIRKGDKSKIFVNPEYEDSPPKPSYVPGNQAIVSPKPLLSKEELKQEMKEKERLELSKREKSEIPSLSKVNVSQDINNINDTQKSDNNVNKKEHKDHQLADTEVKAYNSILNKEEKNETAKSKGFNDLISNNSLLTNKIEKSFNEVGKIITPPTVISPHSQFNESEFEKNLTANSQESVKKSTDNQIKTLDKINALNSSFINKEVKLFPEKLRVPQSPNNEETSEGKINPATASKEVAGVQNLTNSALLHNIELSNMLKGNNPKLLTDNDSVEMDSTNSTLVTSLNLHKKQYKSSDEIDLEKNLNLLDDSDSPIVATDVSLDNPVEDLSTKENNEYHHLTSMDIDLEASFDEISTCNVKEASKTDTYISMMKKIGKVEDSKRYERQSRQVFAQVDTNDNISNIKQNRAEYLNSESLPEVEIINNDKVKDL